MYNKNNAPSANDTLIYMYSQLVQVRSDNQYWFLTYNRFEESSLQLCIQELQNNLTISPLIGDDTPPPRSPLTPSPSPFDSDTLHPPSQEFPLRITPTPDKIDIPKKTSLAKRSIEYKIPIFGVTPPDDDRSRKTTDGILKAARLGDLKMLTELYYEGYSLMSTDETGKTGLHYGARSELLS